MSSIGCARTVCVESSVNRVQALLISAASARKAARLLAVALGAGWLGACAQSAVVTSKSALVGSDAEPAREHVRTTHVATTDRVSVVRKQSATPPGGSEGKQTRLASQGLASFYSEGKETASGEKFDAHALTAAHPSLPFGTRLRVTNVSTGKSVTVRVNDRGPYVAGRVVDVSYSAAQALGMVDGGVAKVRLDVVQ